MRKGKVNSYLPSRAADVQPIRERPVFHELVHEDGLVLAIAQQPHKTLVVEFGEKLELLRKSGRRLATPAGARTSPLIRPLDGRRLATSAGARTVPLSRPLDGRHRPVRKNAFVDQAMCALAKLR